MKKRPILLLVGAFLLLMSGLGLQYFFDHSKTSEAVARQVAVSLEKNLNNAEAEATVLISDRYNPDKWTKVSHSFFLLDGSRVVWWSKNDFVPDWRLMLSPFTERLLQTSGGDYLLKKWPLPDKTILLLVLPLRKNYGLVNNYLKPEWNSLIFDNPATIYDLSANRGVPVCPDHGKCLFSVEATSESGPSLLTWIILFVYITGVVMLIGAGLLSLWNLHSQKQYQQTFLWLTVFLVTIRISLVELDFPNTLIKFHWFDPKQFASSSFNASIGDLFLNSVVVLILCLYLFVYYTRFKVVRAATRSKGKGRWIASAVSLLVAFFALLFPFLYGEVIYHNSSISLEITESLVFESTRIIAFLSLIIGCSCSFLVLHTSLRLSSFLNSGRGSVFITSLTASALAFMVFFLVTERDYWITLLLGVALFSFVHYTRLSLPLSKLTFKSFLYFLIIIMAYSLQATLSIRHFQEDKKDQDLLRYGNNFLVDEDVLGEYLLDESMQQIAKDPFIQLRFSSPFLSKATVRQKIKLFYLSGYFDRYDVKVHLFNQRGEPFDDTEDLNFPDALQEWKKESFRTAYNGIYFINDVSNETAKKYIAVVPVRRRVGIIAGYAVLDLTLKKIIPQNVYPELLVDNRFSQYAAGSNVSYAFYSKDKLTESFGDFNYERRFNHEWLKMRRLFGKGIDFQEYHHTAIVDNKDRIVVVTGLRYPIFFTITNFSFFFIIGLAFLLGFLFFAGIMAIVRRRRLNYSSRIQLYVYLAFFFPLVAVSITTLSLITRSNKDRLVREYGEKARMISERIATPLQNYGQIQIETRSEFQNELVELAKLSDADVSVFSTNGTLLASSQPAIFENHLVSQLVNRRAWNSIVALNDNSFIADERIGTLDYSNSYAAIKSPETGKLLGILSIPFFSSAASLEQSRITVLANILTVFVVIFILFSFLSFFIAKGLTFPLRFITQSLQKTSLTETNQRLVWNSKDEIGLLASEYNRMVQNLEQSKADLVRSQKESTWREIARQVAHEIKNPLTPMKLTLQQWEKSIAAGDMDQERNRRSIALLLAQLDTLNDIAGSFSAFARMPAPVLNKLEITAVLQQAAQLHVSPEEGTVTFEEAGTGPVLVMGDEQLFGRIFSNVILNAFQSGNGTRKITVTIRIVKTETTCVIEVADDGEGIESWVRERVFLPHFSTKKTGSGLGLAIVRQGVEQSGGRIWFKTETGAGTSFFIELPLAQMD